MVARIRTGKTIKGAIHYNEHKVKEGKARLLMAVGFSKEITQLNFFDKWKRLQNLANLNTRAATNCLHISLNFDPSEKPNSDLLKNIAQEYMQGLGFGGQPLLVYQHLDAAHPHLHIVTTNIQRDGQRISLHNLGRLKSEPTRKLLEQKYSLVKADSKRNSLREESAAAALVAASYGKSATKKAITNIVTTIMEQYQFSSLAEFNTLLRPFNVIATRGREGTRMFEKKGLQYSLLDKKGAMVGVPIKASSIHGSPTLARLETKFQEGNQRKSFLQQQLKQRVALCLQASNCLQSFTKNLQQSKIDLVLRKNAEGFIYGVTYIDRQTKSVFNGSDLGKEFSAAAIRLLPGGTTANDKSLLTQVPSSETEMQVVFKKPNTQPIAQDTVIIVPGDKTPYDFVPYEISMRKKRKRKKGKK